MHSNISVSINTLNSWLDRILSEGKSREWSLQDFVEVQDIKGLIKFYEELLPFIIEIEIELPQTATLVSEFKGNRSKLLEELTPKNSFKNLILSWGEFFGRSASNDDLLLLITKIKNNVENVMYQLKINEP